LLYASDTGVLNFAIIFPERRTNRISINEGYDVMFRLINDTFKEHEKTMKLLWKSSGFLLFRRLDLELIKWVKKIAGIASRRV